MATRASNSSIIKDLKLIINGKNSLEARSIHRIEFWGTLILIFLLVIALIIGAIMIVKIVAPYLGHFAVGSLLLGAKQWITNMRKTRSGL